jgi:hypothetical protein
MTKVRNISGTVLRESTASYKVHPNLDAYTHWVLENLVGIKGRTISDVTYFILRDWIQNHREELDHLGLAPIRQGPDLAIQIVPRDDEGTE